MPTLEPIRKIRTSFFTEIEEYLVKLAIAALQLSLLLWACSPKTVRIVSTGEDKKSEDQEEEYEEEVIEDSNLSEPVEDTVVDTPQKTKVDDNKREAKEEDAVEEAPMDERPKIVAFCEEAEKMTFKRDFTEELGALCQGGQPTELYDQVVANAYDGFGQPLIAPIYEIQNEEDRQHVDDGRVAFPCRDDFRRRHDAGYCL